MKIQNRPVKSLILTVALFFCFLILSSCITTRQDVIYLNQQIVSLEETTDRSESISMRESQASLVSEIENLKVEMQRLTSKVENNDLLIKRAVERDTGEQDSLKATLEGFDKRIARLEEALAKLQSGTGPGPAAPKTTPSGPAATPPKTPGETVPADEENYNKTLSLFQEEKYEEAIKGFKNFLQAHSKSELADNAQFWIGECHMALKQYEQAILAYQKVIKDYPNGNKVPNAILRQAAAFTEINDKISAKLLLKKVIKNYPNSPEAKSAESQLRKLEQ
ncbi:tol-pal system protein YbgF [Thermodesulfobacteriota bacterium]